MDDLAYLDMDHSPEGGAGKKQKKRFGCSGFMAMAGGLLVVVLGIVMVLGVISDREDSRRRPLAVTIRDHVEDFHARTGTYPETLEELPLLHDEPYRSYLKGRVFRYTSGETGGAQWYRLVCVNAGMLKSAGSSHRLSWSGIQTASHRKYLEDFGSGTPAPDDDGFCPIDLH